MGSQLHELLAVDQDLQKQFEKILGESSDVFQKRGELFKGYEKHLEMFDEADKQEELGSGEAVSITTTVPKRLDYTWSFISKHFDCIASKEATNQNARADVILSDGTVLLKNLPATLLLTLESKLTKIRAVYELIPTLPSGIKWIKDMQTGLGIWRAETDLITHKTRNFINHKIIVPATDKHPAQVEKWNDQKVVGRYITTAWSGLISSAQKSLFLSRIDELITSVKKARQRANQTTIQELKIGDVIRNYINVE